MDFYLCYLSLRAKWSVAWQSRYQTDKALKLKSQVPNKFQIQNPKLLYYRYVIILSPAIAITLWRDNAHRERENIEKILLLIHNIVINMKPKSWHIALSAVFLFIISYSLLVCDVYANYYNNPNNVHYSISISEFWDDSYGEQRVEDLFLLFTFLFFVLILRFEKTRRIGAILAILAGLFINFTVTIPMLYRTDWESDSLLYIFSAVAFMLSALALLSAGLFFFLKENKTKDSVMKNLN